MPNLKRAAEDFDKWMRKDEKLYGHTWEDHNQALIQYLTDTHDLGYAGFRHIKTYEEFCQLAVLVQASGHETITDPPCSPLDFARAVDKVGPQDYSRIFGEVKPVISTEARLQRAAEDFDRWMKEQERIHRKMGTWENHNQALIKSLTNNLGFRYIKTYEEFCQLAVLVQASGYENITDPPCPPLDFARAVDEVEPQDYSWIFGEVKPVISTEARLQRAAEDFDGWMKKQEIVHRKMGTWENHNQALIKYLTYKKGFHYIKTYEEFCQLAVLVQASGYENITDPPCPPLDFARAVDEVKPQDYSWIFGEVKPVISTEARLQLAAEDFDEWVKRHEKSRREKGIWVNHNQALIDYLTNTSDSGYVGFRYIKTYREFCQLALKLKESYPDITDPSRRPEEYNLIVEKFKTRLKGAPLLSDMFGSNEPQKAVPSLTTLCYFRMFPEDRRPSEQKLELDNVSAEVLTAVEEGLKKMGVLS